MLTFGVGLLDLLVPSACIMKDEKGRFFELIDPVGTNKVICPFYLEKTSFLAQTSNEPGS